MLTKFHTGPRTWTDFLTYAKWEDNIKIDKRSVTGSSEHGNESLGSIKAEEFLEHLSDC
jgi:hypothetical protein